jgi:hypothetical protein
MNRRPTRLQEPARGAPYPEPAPAAAAHLPLPAGRLGLRPHRAVREPSVVVRGAPVLGSWVLRHG